MEKMDRFNMAVPTEWVRDHSLHVPWNDIYRSFQSCKEVPWKDFSMILLSDEGDTIDSSEKTKIIMRLNLDQNGELLFTLTEYLKWTGDINFIKKYSEKIIQLQNSL